MNKDLISKEFGYVENFVKNNLNFEYTNMILSPIFHHLSRDVLEKLRTLFYSINHSSKNKKFIDVLINLKFTSKDNNSVENIVKKLDKLTFHSIEINDETSHKLIEEKDLIDN